MLDQYTSLSVTAKTVMDWERNSVTVIIMVYSLFFLFFIDIS